MKQTIFVSPCPGRCLAIGAFFILKKMNHFENYIALKEQALRVTNILNKINPLEYPWEVNNYHSIDVFIEHGCMDTNVVVIRTYDEINDCQPEGNYGQSSIMFPDQFLYDNETTIQTKIKTNKLWKY